MHKGLNSLSQTAQQEKTPWTHIACMILTWPHPFGPFLESEHCKVSKAHNLVQIWTWRFKVYRIILPTTRHSHRCTQFIWPFFQPIDCVFIRLKCNTEIWWPMKILSLFNVILQTLTISAPLGDLVWTCTVSMLHLQASNKIMYNL